MSGGKATMVKIGIPSSLLYYIYYPMWYTFFTELNMKVVTSEKTNKNILDQGIKYALADACVPVKIFFGHALSLKDKVNYLFIPRAICLNQKTIYCPKFLGMPDMIRFGIPSMPPIIDQSLDNRTEPFALYKAFLDIGKKLGAKNFAITKAYLKAQKVLKTYQNLLLQGFHPPQIIDFLIKEIPLPKKLDIKKDLTLAVLGYPYEVYDQYISVDLLQKLKNLGVKVITLENINPKLLYQKNYQSSKDMFWTFSDLVLRATNYLYQENKVDGVIHLTAFGCGPDSIVDRMMEFSSKQHNNIPFMSLSIDEHSGDAGVSTRLEAFTDMLRRRKGGF